MITAEGLFKAYGRTEVLRGIDLSVERGTVFALLGPNGAGKTTTVRILATLIRPDTGRATIDGHDVVRDRAEVRRRISLTGQYAALDGMQTGEENVRMLARLAGLRGRAARTRAAELIDRFGLTDAATRRVNTYSGGMRRRLDLAAGLVGEPTVLFLDEPTTGLDVRSRQAMWDVIGELTASGVTVFLTTQYLEEADRLAQRIAVLDEGAIVAEGTPGQLKQKFAERRLDLTLNSAETFEAIVQRVEAGTVDTVAIDRPALTVGVATDGSAAHVRAVLDELDPDRTGVERFEVHTATLDDVFLALTGHAANPVQNKGKEQAGVRS